MNSDGSANRRRPDRSGGAVWPPPEVVADHSSPGAPRFQDLAVFPLGV